MRLPLKINEAAVPGRLQGRSVQGISPCLRMRKGVVPGAMDGLAGHFTLSALTGFKNQNVHGAHVQKPAGAETVGAARSPKLQPRVRQLADLPLRERGALQTVTHLCSHAQSLEKLQEDQLAPLGLVLVTSSLLCDQESLHGKVVSTIDEWEGDGMAVPMQANQKSEGASRTDFRQGWDPNQSLASQVYTSLASSYLGQIGAERDFVELGDHKGKKGAQGLKGLAASALQPLALGVTAAASTVRKPINSVAATAMAVVKTATVARSLQGPQSSWLVCDEVDTQVRYIVVVGGNRLPHSPSQLQADLVPMEKEGLGALVSRGLYEEATALYSRLLPLMLEHLQGEDGNRLCLTGQGVGGSLATLLMIMLTSRGISQHCLSPVYALDSPNAICQVPDRSLWCDATKGCTLSDMQAMVDDASSRGVLAELGLGQGSVKNIYRNPAAGSRVKGAHWGDMLWGLTRQAHDKALGPEVPVGVTFGGSRKPHLFTPVGQVYVEGAS